MSEIHNNDGEFGHGVHNYQEVDPHLYEMAEELGNILREKHQKLFSAELFQNLSTVCFLPCRGKY